MSDSKTMDSALDELDKVKTYQRFLLETLNSGVILLDANDVVINNNEAALRIWGLSSVRIAGTRLYDTELLDYCPELFSRLESSRLSPGLQRFEYRPGLDGEEHTVVVTLRPVVTDDGIRMGTIVSAEDVTHHERLQSTVEQLESTGEELQSANEELQTTNEELETTNEELQSTNEELETTNEELQSLNEELENMNEELESRTRAFNVLTTQYLETLQAIPWPVMLVDSEERVQMWNAPARRLFGFSATQDDGVDLNQLPLPGQVRHDIVRRCRSVLQTSKPSILRGQKFSIDGVYGELDVHYTPFTSNDSLQGVLMMFGPNAQEDNRRPLRSPARKSKPGTKARAKTAVQKQKRVVAKRTPSKKQ